MAPIIKDMETAIKDTLVNCKRGQKGRIQVELLLYINDIFARIIDLYSTIDIDQALDRMNRIVNQVTEK